MPQRFDKAIRDEWLSLRKQSDVLSEPAQHNPDLLLPRPTQAPQTAPCPNCGASIAPFILEHDLRCPHCGKTPSEIHNKPLINPNSARDFFHDVGPRFYGNIKTADVSMPPEGPPIQPKETALPYNPGAYEGMVENMHPAAQYTYERAVQQGASPEAAMSAAQEKQGEMMKRTQEGQNVEGVQIPVIS